MSNGCGVKNVSAGKCKPQDYQDCNEVSSADLTQLVSYNGHGLAAVEPGLDRSKFKAPSFKQVRDMDWSKSAFQSFDGVCKKGNKWFAYKSRQVSTPLEVSTESSETIASSEKLGFVDSIKQGIELFKQGKSEKAVNTIGVDRLVMIGAAAVLGIVAIITLAAVVKSSGRKRKAQEEKEARLAKIEAEKMARQEQINRQMTALDSKRRDLEGIKARINVSDPSDLEQLKAEVNVLIEDVQEVSRKAMNDDVVREARIIVREAMPIFGDLERVAIRSWRPSNTPLPAPLPPEIPLELPLADKPFDLMKTSEPSSGRLTLSPGLELTPAAGTPLPAEVSAGGMVGAREVEDQLIDYLKQMDPLGERGQDTFVSEIEKANDVEIGLREVKVAALMVYRKRLSDKPGFDGFAADVNHLLMTASAFCERGDDGKNVKLTEAHVRKAMTYLTNNRVKNSTIDSILGGYEDWVDDSRRVGTDEYDVRKAVKNRRTSDAPTAQGSVASDSKTGRDPATRQFSAQEYAAGLFTSGEDSQSEPLRGGIGRDAEKTVVIADDGPQFTGFDFDGEVRGDDPESGFEFVEIDRQSATISLSKALKEHPKYGVLTERDREAIAQKVVELAFKDQAYAKQYFEGNSVKSGMLEYAVEKANGQSGLINGKSRGLSAGGPPARTDQTERMAREGDGFRDLFDDPKEAAEARKLGEKAFDKGGK